MTLAFVLGTKGQLIKTAPVMQELGRRNVPFDFVAVGQHGARLNELSAAFELQDPVPLLERASDVASMREGMMWAVQLLARMTLRPPRLRGNAMTVIVHGDAPPALMGLWFAARQRARLAHLEAGERTYRLNAPFPEEAIRRFVDRFSGLHIASSLDSAAMENLRQEGIVRTAVDLGCNTLLDSLRYALSKPAPPKSEKNYCLFSVHRLETLQNAERLERIVQFAEAAAKQRPVVFPLHESTRAALRRFDLLKRLEDSPGVDLRPLFPYFEFMHVIRKARFVVTDGGGPQQESYYMGRPCFVAREVTERPSYPNCVLGGFDAGKFREFLDSFEGLVLRNSLVDDTSVRPSVTCIEALQAFDERRR